MSDPIGSLREALANRYEFQAEIGQGAYATVYRAVDLRHERLVAVKVLHVHPASDLAEQRFVREIKWLARLQHPNILPLHDSGHVANLLYFIMPYLSGETLRDRIHRERRLAVPDAVSIAREIADALQYAHGCGVIHRDIKPDNILLSGAHPVVADFGVARAIDTALANQITRTGPGSPGTPAYMSPEQLLGGRNVDQRSDIYSLGCVLYEMLTGKAPFAGKEGFVKRFTEPPSLRDVTSDLPAALDAAVARALATDPGQRYTSALEFARVLELVSRGDQPLPEPSSTPLATPVRVETTPVVDAPPVDVAITKSRNTTARRIAIACVMIVAAAVGLLATRLRPRAALDDNLLAIAPFGLFGTDTIWREGLMDVLVRNLDGAGALRTVSAASSLQHSTGFSDPSSAEELGRAVHARLVVFGSVMRAGSDSVRVIAAIMDVRRKRALPPLQWQDASSRIDRLTDSVTVGLLRQISEQLGSRSLSHVSIAAATSVPALKEFLRGEQYFRRTVWDSALSAYQRATSLDSNFVLPLWRAGVVESWIGAQAEADAYKLRAGQRNHGLGPRDSLLVAADYLFAEADTTTDDLRTWSLATRLHGTLAEAASRYGDDAEVWYARGDALFHFQSTPRPIATAELLGIFQRAIALDSTFAPAYVHAIELAFVTAQDDLARRLIAAYLDLQPTDVSATTVRTVEAIVANGVTSAAARRALADASPAILHSTLDMLGLWPDSAEAGVTVARQLLARAVSAGTESERATARFQLARELALRGHLAEAYNTLSRPQADALAGSRRLIADLAGLGAIDADTVRAAAARWEKIDPLATRVLLPWYAQRRDTIGIRKIAQAAADVAKDTVARDAWRRTIAQYTMSAVQAYLALATSDTTAALRLFDALPDSLCQLCYMDRWTRIRLLQRAGRHRDAAREATEFLPRYRAPGFVLFALEEARAASKLGDATTARQAFSRVIATWRNPDPVLYTYVNEARAALHRPAR